VACGNVSLGECQAFSDGGQYDHCRWCPGTLCQGLICQGVGCVDFYGGLHGRYLFAAPKSGIVFAYGSQTPVEFNQAVSDGTKALDVGMIRFDYDTYSADPEGNDGGGAALAGGLFANANIAVKPGFQLQWVQVVTASRTGSDAMTEWNLPETNAGEYPDAPPESKRYPFDTTKVTLIPPATLGFQDFPRRNFSNPANETWRAELGLVCVASNAGGDGFREVRVISTLRWGFDITIHHAAPFGVADVTAHVPSNWGAPQLSYLNTLNNSYDGLGGGGGPGFYCTGPAATAGLPCNVNADCDSAAGAGDGVCTQGAAVRSGKFRFAHNENCFEEVTIPAVSEWGLVVMMLLTLTAGTLMFRRHGVSQRSRSTFIGTAA